MWYIFTAVASALVGYYAGRTSWNPIADRQERLICDLLDEIEREREANDKRYEIIHGLDRWKQLRRGCE